MNRCITIDREQARRLLEYDAKTGKLRWSKEKDRNLAGKLWGSYPQDGGYVNGRFCGVKCRAHQLVFLLHHGYIPEKCIDHINGDKQDNRVENLREFSYACNRINCTNNSRNTSGVVGVVLATKHQTWKAAIKISGRRFHIGTAVDFEEAVCLRFAAEQCLSWGECKHRTTARDYVERVIQRRIMVPLREQFRAEYPEMWEGEKA